MSTVRIDIWAFVTVVGFVFAILPVLMGVLGYHAFTWPWDRKREGYAETARSVAWMGTPGAVIFLIGLVQVGTWLTQPGSL